MDALRTPFRFLYRKLGRRYPRVMLALQFQVTYLVVLGGVGLLSLYEHISFAHFWHIMAFVEGMIAIENVASLQLAFRLVRPADPWLDGDRSPERAGAAWRALAGLPLDFWRHRRAKLILLELVAISVFVDRELALPWQATVALALGAAITMLYGVLVRYFSIELIMRPVLEAISHDLPDGSVPTGAGVPLKVKMLFVLPAINVITGAIVAAISTRHGHFGELEIHVLAAFAVASTISLELTVLLSRSVLEPISDLRRATARVAEGDFSVRVPVISSDETGALAVSFNQMVAGLAERARLREAIDAYVDPDLTARIVEEGIALGAEEAEVTVVFVDIREFTSFAERSSAVEVVRALNEYFELIVPVVVRHGGHANKFLGDGLLAVFGAPDPLRDHADRALEAALEIASVVREQLAGRLAIGIGINSGPVVAGTIGGGGRLEFTVVGDPVNTAARVQEVTRETGDEILLSEATRALLVREHAELEPRTPVTLKGKLEEVRLYAPPAGEPLRPRGHGVAEPRATIG